MDSIEYDIALKVEDEYEIIQVFNRLMRYSEHSTEYSFNKYDDKPYLIYNENGIWILDYSVGTNREILKYTNLYSLCMHLLKHFNNPNIFSFVSNSLIRIPCGTKVVVMNNDLLLANDVDEYISIGTIINSNYNQEIGKEEYIIKVNNNKQIKAVLKGFSKSPFGKNPFIRPILKEFNTMESFLNEANLWILTNEAASVGYVESDILMEAYNKVKNYKNNYLEINNKTK